MLCVRPSSSFKALISFEVTPVVIKMTSIASTLPIVSDVGRPFLRRVLLIEQFCVGCSRVSLFVQSTAFIFSPARLLR